MHSHQLNSQTTYFSLYFANSLFKVSNYHMQVFFSQQFKLGEAILNMFLLIIPFSLQLCVLISQFMQLLESD